MMYRIFRAPLMTVMTVIAVGIGAMTAGAKPAAAMSDRDAMGLILGLGAAAVLLNQVDRNDRPRHQPPPRVQPPRPNHWDRAPARHDPRWNRGPDRPRGVQAMGPRRGPDHGPYRHR